VTLRPRTRTILAWALWLATMAACVTGLVVALLVARPLTAQVLLDGALYALGFPLGYATVGLVLTLPSPARPCSWSAPS
jgi:ethanolamine utilization microcompartment shell protein EutL